MDIHFNGYFLYSLSIYHFTLSSSDTLSLFLDYKPKSGDSLDTSTDNFTAFTGNHSTVRNSLKKFSSSLFYPNFLSKSCTVTFKKLLANFCNFVKYMCFGHKIKVLNQRVIPKICDWPKCPFTDHFQPFFAKHKKFKKMQKTEKTLHK